MVTPLMPKATAIWLIDNTKLTFQQIADFCGLHALEIQAIADGESAVGMVGLDPIAAGQLSLEEITRCEENATARLEMLPAVTPDSVLNNKRCGKRYTPMAKRQERPDAIAWVLKHCPEFNDAQICRLLSTTRVLLKSVRDKTHWNMANVKPRHPVQLGLCTQAELDELMAEIAARADHGKEAAVDEAEEDQTSGSQSA